MFDGLILLGFLKMRSSRGQTSSLPGPGDVTAANRDRRMSFDYDPRRRKTHCRTFPAPYYAGRSSEANETSLRRLGRAKTANVLPSKYLVQRIFDRQSNDSPCSTVQCVRPFLVFRTRRQSQWHLLCPTDTPDAGIRRRMGAWLPVEV